MHQCLICGVSLPLEALQRHLTKCVERNADVIDHHRPAGAPFEGDPELLAFARAEGDVYNRQPGTRRQPR